MENFLPSGFPVRKIIGWVFIISGMICIIPLLVFGIPKWDFFKSSLYADGRVVELSKPIPGEPNVFKNPVFAFSDNRRIEYKVYFYEPRAEGFGLGSRVQVLYPPQNPKDAIIYDFLQYWAIPLVMIYLVFSNMIIGLIVLFWPRIISLFVKPRPDGKPTV